LAELEALGWLQDQIAVFSHGDNNEAVLGYYVLLLLQLMWQGTKEVFDRINEYPLSCLMEVYMINNVHS
jgi:hypothetical protein